MEYFGLKIKLVMVYGIIPVFVVEEQEMPYEDRVRGGTVDICPLCMNGKIFNPDDMRLAGKC
jgi:uncharacterized protein (DUF983 family)